MEIFGLRLEAHRRAATNARLFRVGDYAVEWPKDSWRPTARKTRWGVIAIGTPHSYACDLAERVLTIANSGVLSEEDSAALRVAADYVHPDVPSFF